MLASLRCRGLAFALLVAFVLAKAAFWFPLADSTSSEPKRACACTGAPICCCPQGSCCNAAPAPQPSDEETSFVISGPRFCGSLALGGAGFAEAPMIDACPFSVVWFDPVGFWLVDRLTPGPDTTSLPPDAPPPRIMAS